MPQLVANQPPPIGYYADNLLLVIDTVFTQYEDLLTPSEREFTYVSKHLSQQALRLLARLLSRSRTLMRVDSLSYPDVPDLVDALTELNEARMISLNEELENVDILELLTVQELKKEFAKVRSFGRKAEMIAGICASYTEEEIGVVLRAKYVWLNVIANESFELYCLLFFGNTVQRLDEFVIRDLGLTRFESYSLDPQYRLFPNRRAIDRHLELVSIANIIHELGVSVDSSIAGYLTSELAGQEFDQVSERRRSRALNALGRNLERMGANEQALKCYGLSTLHPSRERTMRVFKRLGDDSKLEATRKAIHARPYCLEEQLFARQFAVDRGTSNQVIDTREDMAPTGYEQGIEAYAVERLAAEGCQAWHLENILPQGLFGLAYWDWLFASVRGAFVNQFQMAPLDLYWPTFFESRRSICKDPLDATLDLKTQMLDIVTRKRGISCQLVAWQVLTDELVRTLMRAMEADQLKRFLSIMVEDLRQFRAGFPDLTVIHPQRGLQFVEVKGPGDQLRPNQKLWIERLTQADFDVHVWRFK